MPLILKNYLINSALPTCLHWLRYVFDASNTSLNVAVCQSIQGLGESASWRTDGEDAEPRNQERQGPPLSSPPSEQLLSRQTCIRFHHYILTVQLHVDLLKSHLSILINKLGHLEPLLCVEKCISQMPIFSVIKMRECCTWICHGDNSWCFKHTHTHTHTEK